MKYAIDRIENNIAILEDISNSTKKEVPITELPEHVKEGSIILFENEKYYLDIKEERLRSDIIKSKFDMLRKK